jgi:hypothetical protein
MAISRPGSVAIGNEDLDVRDVALATLYYGTKTLFWGGGALPVAANSIEFEFPDGSTVPATVDGGYWVMQHYYRDVPSERRLKVIVRIYGSTSIRTLELTGAKGFCNQIVHGC